MAKARQAPKARRLAKKPNGKRTLAKTAAVVSPFSTLLPSDATVRGLLDSAPDAMVITDQTGTIVLVNTQAEKLFGRSRQELLGEKVELLIPERSRGRHAGFRSGFMAEPRLRVMGSGLELHGLRRDGSEFPVEVSLSPLQTKHGLLVSSAIRDITERRQLEWRITEANRRKSEFLANMSHELRTPLNAIIGFAELMHKGKVGPVSSDHKEYLGDILVSARHLLQLINDVLDLAKVESGKMEIRPEAVDLQKIADEVSDILRGISAGKKIDVQRQVHPEVAHVVVDPGRVKQILYNYLSNALKFTPDGGRVQIRFQPEGPSLFRLEVEDNGIGIATDQVDKLFVEFEQLDAGSAKRFQGTGLGLALSKRLAQAQGGRVEVCSTLGKGSVFSAILPRRVMEHGRPYGG